MNHEAGVVEVRLDEIIPNRFQPRISFDEKALNDLSESIRQHGIIQPLVLRRVGDKYEIIAGERRYKAAGMAGLTVVPAIIANIDDNTSAEVALVENIQRKDLSAVEEALSYKNLLDKGYLTQDLLAKRLGVSQSAISNKLRLLNLDQEVQDALMSEKISERHARALLQLEDLEDQKKWLQRIIRERMTVRQLDIELKKLKDNGEESNDVPLVNLTPNVEEIKNNAVDIHPEAEPKIMEDIFGDQQPQIEEEKPMVPETPSEMPRKFFNFLEDEEANLNTNEETIIKPEPTFGPLPTIETPIPPIVSTEETDNLPTNMSEEETPNVEDTEVLDFATPIPSSFDSNIITPEPASAPSVVESDNVIPESFMNEEPTTPPPLEENRVAENDIPSYEPAPNIVDPVNMIDHLDPTYEEKQDAEAGLDLNTAIADIRNLISNIENRGFKTDIEEINFDQSYQINIKIEKE